MLVFVNCVTNISHIDQTLYHTQYDTMSECDSITLSTQSRRLRSIDVTGIILCYKVVSVSQHSSQQLTLWTTFTLLLRPHKVQSCASGGGIQWWKMLSLSVQTTHQFDDFTAYMYIDHMTKTNYHQARIPFTRCMSPVKEQNDYYINALTHSPPKGGNVQTLCCVRWDTAMKCRSEKGKL